MASLPHFVEPSQPDSASGPISRILPGIIAGAGDLDPAAVMTAVVAGATFGHSVGWVVVASVPVLLAVFSVASRLGDESRRGLVQLIRGYYGKRASTLIAIAMVMVNLAMIVADLRAVGDALSIILNVSFLFFLAPVAFSVWWILMKGNFQRVTKVLAVLALAQLAYLASAVLATHTPLQLLRDILVPRLTGSGSEYAMGIIAVFGSLLTPDVIVWQTSSRKDTNRARTGHTQESRVGTLIAAAISLSAIISASVLHVQNPGDLTTRTAAEALSPLGTAGPILFSLGIIGSGLVALPILIASMCFSIAEAADWRSGINQNPWEAPLYYSLMSGSVILAVVVNYWELNTVKVLYYSQVVAGVLVVPILWYILRLANNRYIVQRANTIWQNFWLGGAIGGMIAANGILVWSCLK